MPKVLINKKKKVSVDFKEIYLRNLTEEAFNKIGELMVVLKEKTATKTVLKAVYLYFDLQKEIERKNEEYAKLTDQYRASSNELYELKNFMREYKEKRSSFLKIQNQFDNFKA